MIYNLRDVSKLTNEEKPYIFAIDVDPIAYNGACAVEKVEYRWVNQQEGEISPTLYSAEDAKDWIVSECWGTDPEDLGWERVSKKVIKSEEEAIKATDNVVKDYLKTCEKFGRVDKPHIYYGFLTQSGLKNKDVKGLEKEYQHNRKGEKAVPKPKYLEVCRQHLLTKYPWIKMAREGFEADTHVIAYAERYNFDACILTIDKDLHQAEDTWYINCYDPLYQRVMVRSTEVGSLWVIEDGKGKVKYKGSGFKWLCYQAVAGDSSDGFTGLPRAPLKKFYEAIKDLTSKADCVKTVRTFYETKFKNGYVDKTLKEEGEEIEKGTYKYRSWDGVRYSPTIEGLMQQHFFLAYQERSPNDVFNVEEYLT